MHALSLPALHRVRDAAPLILRIVAGITMAYHGWQKVQGGVGGFGGFIGSLGVPAPALVAYLVTALELVGGIMLVIGLLTRIVALLLAIEMILTTLLVKLDVGLVAPQGGGAGAEIDLLFMAAFLALVFLGPGRPSVDHAIDIEEHRADDRGMRRAAA